ncbi:MAG: carboxypeptidase regulatory-like domain-containing protein, partial [Nanoarchaeota archaeon]|nr:carboxypeptidase regulatory-like domain-containing protein [Nanoarchaeota archaeon]
MKRKKKENKLMFVVVLTLLVVGATFSAVYVKDFIGFAVSIASQAGYITQLVIEHQYDTNKWQGYYGYLFMESGATTSETKTANPAGIDKYTFVFDCLEPDATHELYASLVDPGELDWTTIVPARPEWVDNVFNVSPGVDDSATKTFTDKGNVTVGVTYVNNVNVTFTKKNGDPSSTVFMTGVLNVSGDVVFYTEKGDAQTGWNDDRVHYQIILPAPNTTIYYFFTDPNDDCPAGYGTGQVGDGFVSGYATDNSTGAFIEGVTVSIGSSSNLTDSNGFFNITAVIGYQYIVGVKAGYYTYASLINVTLYDSIWHNITMNPVPATAANGTIEGYVIDNRTNSTLAGVKVNVGGVNLTTDSNGFYNSSLAEGNHTLAALLSGYDTYVGYADIIRYTTTIYNFSMEPSIGTVEGFVTDNSSGAAISNVLVGIGNGSVYTNSSGGYSINIIKGEYYVIGTKSGYDNYANNLTVIASTTTLHNFEMSVKESVGDGDLYENGTVSGYVIDNSTSLALENVTVTIAGVSYATDSNGFYNISMIEGTHNIVAVKSGYDNYINNVSVITNNVTVHNITMSLAQETIGENGSLIGSVTNSVGSILEGATISIAGLLTSSNSTGDYDFDLRSGAYNLVATKSGYDNYISTVTIVAGNITTHDIVMNTSAAASTGLGPGLGSGSGAGSGAGQGAGTGVKTTATKKVEEYEDHAVSLDKIIKKLRMGSFLNIPITISNYRTGSMTVTLAVEGNVAPLVKLDKTTLNIDADSDGEFTLTLLGNVETGVYEGDLIMSGDVEKVIPIDVLVYDADKLPIEVLLVRLRLFDEKVYTGDVLRYKVDIQNLLSEEEYDVRLTYKIIREETGEETVIDTDDVRVHTSFSLIKNYPIPKDFDIGEYKLIVEADYFELKSTHTAIFKVVQPIYRYAVWGIIPLWMILVGVAALAIGVFVYMLYKKKKAEKQRYKMEVDVNELPKAGPRSAFAGNVAETTKKTYFDLDKFQIHTLIAGASGSGKTVAAQSLVEEALMKGVAVLVFDPSATWTGFLRKMSDKKMLALYPKFGLKPTDARPFNGNVHQITDGREILEFRKYMKPGEINVFVTTKLDTSRSELLVANAIKEVFHANLPEETQLKYLIIYDGIHTLLPKYGGSGKVFMQIERATREFRKWGVGVILLSQVLSDFPPQVLANINTEIQTRTRDENDLKRITEEYGGDIVKSLVKAGVGTGMVENAAYNKGKPYFVQFRPVLHSLDRLDEKELESYSKYNAIIDDLEWQLDSLKKEGVDIFDLELELKLAKDKVKSGNFNMVDIYLEGLKPRILAQWDKIGKKPTKMEIKLASEDDLDEEVEKAEKE